MKEIREKLGAEEILVRINTLLTIFRVANKRLPTTLIVGPKEMEELNAMKTSAQNINIDKEFQERFGLVIEEDEDFSIWVK